MYTNFYNLKEKPFNLTPSPRYLYLGEVHKEALAFLTYGVVERKGFIVLTGEVGTGKTTMVQALLTNLDENVDTVYISNPMLSGKDFIDYLAFSAFKRKVRFKSKAEFLVEFEKFLKDCLRNQRIFLLIVDEAQRLSFSLLEEIRLLSNMETADEKLANIFLIGQPELNEKLNEPRCRALLQRVSVRHHIQPLDLDETRQYVLTRLKIAGAAHGEKIFPKSTIKALYEYSEGYPRMINILADNALLLGYSRGKARITSDIIREAYDDVRPKPETTPAGGKTQAGAKAMPEARRAKVGAGWKWAFVLLVLALVAVVVSVYRTDIATRVERLLSSVSGPLSKPVVKRQIIPQKPKVDIESPVSSETRAVESLESIPINEQEKSTEAPGDQLAQASVRPNQDEPAGEVSPQPEREDLTSWRVRVVRPGDTLAQLAMEVYGYTDQKVLDLIKSHNPDITNINLINVGQKIVFPPISAKSSGSTYTVYIASYGPFSAARQQFQRLTGEGYEAYIIPANDPEKGKIYRVTLGNFDKLQYAQEYASMLVEKGIAPYAKPIRLEVR